MLTHDPTQTTCVKGRSIRGGHAERASVEDAVYMNGDFAAEIDRRVLELYERTGQ